MLSRFTQKQEQYLAFIYSYKRLKSVAPVLADYLKYLKSDPASVYTMLKKLESNGLISREREKH